MMHYRQATAFDLSYVYDIELKCQDKEPSDAKWWSDIVKKQSSACIVGCRSNVPVAMTAFESMGGDIFIHKLCVREAFRNQGIGKNLIQYVDQEAKYLNYKNLSIVVPEYKCRPDSCPASDVSKWLNKMGFTAREIIPDKLSLWGQEFDQYLFVREVV